MIVIRLDRRVLFALLAVVGIALALGLGIFLGRMNSAGGTQTAASAPSTSQQAPVQPQAPAAAQPPAAQQAPNVPNVPLITVDEARQKYGQPNVIMVDARTEQEFKSGHIKGAVNVPVNEIQNRLNLLPRDKDLIIYCN